MPKMNPTTKKGLTIAIILATVGVSGLAIRYFYKKWKTKKEEADALLIAQLAETSSPSLSSPTSSSGKLSLKECRKKNPFPTKAEVKKFQNWVISKYGNILGKTGADSDFGCLTNSAWEKYGVEYTKESKTDTGAGSPNPSASETTISSDALKTAKDFIVYSFTGDKNWIKTRVDTANPEFVLAWEKSLRKFKSTKGAYGSAFVFANQVYSVHNGDRVLNFNPIGRKAINAKTSILLRSEPKMNPQYTQAFSMPNIPIGNVNNVYWNNTEKKLYYITDRQNYIWVLASDVKFA